jgi:hypothetical protein
MVSILPSHVCGTELVALQSGSGAWLMTGRVRNHDAGNSFNSPNNSRSRCMPRRMRVLMVPSGAARRSAICSCHN